ncbi:MAG: hypothetical protein Q9200_007754, partial [Gallowayella weberi]
MFASTFISRLTSSTSQPLLPISSTQILQPPFTDIPQPSPTDTTATLLALARQEAHLQSHIQYLLDVQSDRLLEGLGVDTTPAPTTQPPQTHSSNNDVQTSTKPTRPNKTPTLQETRTHLLTAISTLLTLKQQTLTIISASLSHTTTTLSHITTLATKKTNLVTTIRDLESSTELQHLATQERDLSAQIQAVENTLSEMRARQRGLRQQLREGRNREEAR